MPLSKLKEGVGQAEVMITNGTLTTFATEAALLTDEELELVRSKIPLIDKVLSISSSRQLAMARDKLPDAAKTLINLDSAKLEKINSHLSNATVPINELVD
ncbi:hypothetical protein TSMEX_011008, partial [Taenia solium]